ncbi:hypothetical protein BJL95_06385 [Methylomonas sp. LWB]|nr:hypothetical protein BJL95_06385 [Methylomonas sp. LWB]
MAFDQAGLLKPRTLVEIHHARDLHHSRCKLLLIAGESPGPRPSNPRQQSALHGYTKTLPIIPVRAPHQTEQTLPG